MAKQKPRAPAAHLWAIRSPHQRSPLPQQVVVELEGARQGVRLSVLGWSSVPPDTSWTYDRITKNLEELEIQWAQLHGAEWTLEVREEPRQPLPALPQKIVAKHVRVRVHGWLEFASTGDRRRVVANALADEYASDCSFVEDDLDTNEQRLALKLDQRLPAPCWNATVRVLLLLGDSALAGDLTAELEAGEKVLRLAGAAEARDLPGSSIGAEAPPRRLTVTVNGKPFVHAAPPPPPPQDDEGEEDDDEELTQCLSRPSRPPELAPPSRAFERLVNSARQTALQRETAQQRRARRPEAKGHVARPTPLTGPSLRSAPAEQGATSTTHLGAHRPDEGAPQAPRDDHGQGVVALGINEVIERITRAPNPEQATAPNEVGVLGLSGVGKSSLLNALIAPGRQVFPAGGIGPLTGLPLRIVGAPEPVLRMRYRPRKWLHDQMRALRDDAANTPDKLGRLSLVCTGDQHGTRDPAWLLQALRHAIHPDQAAPPDGTSETLSSLRRLHAVLAHAGTERRHLATDGEAEYFTLLRSHTAGQFAPLCELVEVGWPAQLLKAGLALCDLPGLGSVHDTHASHASAWLSTATVVVLVVDRAGIPEVVLEALLKSGFVDRLIRDQADLLVAITKLDLIADDHWRAQQPRRAWSEHFFDAARRAAEQLELQLHTALLVAHRATTIPGRSSHLHDALARVAYCGVSSRERHRLADPVDDAPRVKSPESTGIPELERTIIDVVQRRRGLTSRTNDKPPGASPPPAANRSGWEDSHEQEFDT